MPDAKARFATRTSTVASAIRTVRPAAAAAFGRVASLRRLPRSASRQRSRSGRNVRPRVSAVAAATPPMTAAASPPTSPITSPAANRVPAKASWARPKARKSRAPSRPPQTAGMISAKAIVAVVAIVAAAFPRPAAAITAATIPPSPSTHNAQGASPRTVSRREAPARPRRPASSSSATSRATLAWNASGGTAAISVITTSATRIEYSAGESTRASAIWKSAFRPLAVKTATPTNSPGPNSVRAEAGRRLMPGCGAVRSVFGVATPPFSAPARRGATRQAGIVASRPGARAARIRPHSRCGRG